MTEKIPVTIAFCNLAGEEFAALAAEDAATIGALFERVHVPPAHRLSTAPILFIYARVTADGTLDSVPGADLRKVAGETGARIIVLASPNPGGGMPKGEAAPDASPANFVFTVDRKGPAFAKFFRGLFERMHDGQDMLQAWVSIAPQMPGGDETQPDTVLLPEAGALAFPPGKPD